MFVNLSLKLKSFALVFVFLFTTLWANPIYAQDNTGVKFIQIAAGEDHTIALKSDGSVWAWGDNSNGQLGDGTKANSMEPVMLGTISDVTAISANDDISMALKKDGTVWAWGYNEYGRLGNGTEIDSLKPTQVSGLTNVTAISAGGTHCLALKQDGTVWAWGRNFYGQLGNSSNKNSSVPVKAAGLSKITAISAGEKHSMALASDGTIWVWGDNDYGELGLGSTDGKSIPTQLTNLDNVIFISAGNIFSAAVKKDGTLWTWGYNGYGQLGNGTEKDSLRPVRVSSVSNVVKAATGKNHMLAMTSDGTIWACGYNNYGQLGNGTKDKSAVPVQSSGITGAEFITTTFSHNFAMCSDGSVWAWGRNYNYQIAEDKGNEVLVPVEITVLKSENTVTQSNGPSIDLLAVQIQDSVDLSWTATNIDNIEGYYVYRSKASGQYAEPLTDFPLLKREYTDKKVEAGTTYYYIVKAVLTGNKLSSPSNEMKVTIKSSASTADADSTGSSKITIVLQIDNPKMLVNGVEKEIDPGKGTSPVIIEERTMIPIRAVIEALGGSIDWDGSDNKVIISAKNKKVNVWIGKKNINVDGQYKEMDVVPQVINDRTMIPLRFVIENLGCELQWDSFNNKITITSDAPKSEAGKGSSQDSGKTASTPAPSSDPSPTPAPSKVKGEINGGKFIYNGTVIFDNNSSLDWASMSPNEKYVAYKDGQYISYYDTETKEHTVLYKLTTDEYIGKFVFNYGYISPIHYDFVEWSEDSTYIVVDKWTPDIFKGGSGLYKISLSDKSMTFISKN